MLTQYILLMRFSSIFAMEQRIHIGQVWSSAIALWGRRWQSMLAIIGAALAVIGTAAILFYAAQRVLLNAYITLAGFSTYRIVTFALGYIAYLALSAAAQALLIDTLLHERAGLREAMTVLREKFASFFLWTVFFSIGMGITTAPLYAGVAFIFYFGQTVVGALAIALGILTILLFSAYVFATPFILIETNFGLGRALSSSAALAHHRAGAVIGALMPVVIALFGASIIGPIAGQTPYIGFILHLGIIVISIMFSFAYMARLYTTLK